MRSIFFPIAIAIAAMLFSSCENYSDSLTSDAPSLVKCPANGCANTKADANEMTVHYVGPKPIFSLLAEQSLSVGGDCFPSLFPNNEISVKVLNASSVVVAQSPSAAIVSVDGANIKCVQGRYNFVIDTTSVMSLQGNYRVRLQLMGIDANGAVLNGPGAIVEIPVNRF